MNMKKLISLALALVMLLAMSATAMAATYTLTLNNAQPGHTYTAYQIFTGDLHEGVLSNIVWGDGVTSDGQTALGDAAAKAESLKTTADAEAFAAAVASYLDEDKGKSVKIEDGATSGAISGLEAGYYLVQTTAMPDENGVKTHYILIVVKDTEATIKADVPEVDKEVNDTNVNIGDVVTFTLTATMPSKLNGFETYKVVFHDTLSDGLAYVEDSVKVTVDGEDKTDAFDVDVNEENGELTISCDDVIALGAKESSEIVVIYKAIVDKDAVIGGTGNPNEVYLEYSNDPNWNGEGTEPTGDTPKDEVVVFTFELDVTKVDGNDATKKLEGAEFKLQNAAGKWVTVDADGKVTGWVDAKDSGSTLISDANGFFKIVGLEAGEYTLVETKAPAGYNLLDKEIKINIEYETTLTDESEENDNDEYAVSELKITVTIDKESSDAEGTPSTGIVETTVENNAGATLPDTGAQGTKMIYMVGGILVAAAAILLITKRRMNAAE